MLAVSVVFGAQPASAQAQSGQPLPEILYADILKAPDDLQLNFAFARQEAQKGNLLLAASSLERVLLLEPEWNTARLFYALVLYRLDDLSSTKRELKLLSTQELPAEQKAQVAKYIALVNKRLRRFRARGYLGVGGRWDSNRNFATTDDQVLILGLPATVLTSPDADFALRGYAGISLQYDINPVERHVVFLNARTVANEQIDMSSQSFIDSYGQLGIDYYLAPFTVSPSIEIRSIVLDEEAYLTEAGGTLAIKTPISSRVEALISASAYHQDYNSIGVAPSGRLRTGARVSVTGQLKYDITSRNRVTARASFDDKNADFDAFAYQNTRLSLDFRHLIGRGAFLRAQGDISWAGFDAPDPLFTILTTREDTRFGAKFVAGAPIRTIAGYVDLETPDWTSQITMQVSADYREQNSNLAIYDYRNFGIETNLVWNFDL
jgi:hypothetical protein